MSSQRSQKRKVIYEEKTPQKKVTTNKFAARPVKRGPRPEVKFHDTEALISAPLQLIAGRNYTDVTSGQLVLIPQGTDRNQRIGRDVYLKTLHIRAEVDFFFEGADPTKVNRFRCIAFYDTEAGAVSANVPLEVYKSRAASKLDMNITRNLTDSTRYKVLFNGLSPTMAGNGSGLSLPDKFTWEYDIPLNQKVRYAGSATAIPNNHQLYLFFMSDDDQVAGVFNPRFTYQSRVTFYDM